MCDLAREGSPRAEITFPRARRPLLMEIPSLIRSPAAAVRLSCIKYKWVSQILHFATEEPTNPFGSSEINEMELRNDCGPLPVIIATFRR